MRKILLVVLALGVCAAFAAAQSQYYLCAASGEYYCSDISCEQKDGTASLELYESKELCDTGALNRKENNPSQPPAAPQPSGTVPNFGGAIVDPRLLNSFVRTTINIGFARPLSVGILPLEQSTVPASMLATGNNNLEYTITLENTNKFRIEAYIDSITKSHSTLSIKKGTLDLARGFLATDRKSVV